ncbi:MAG: metallophosphoesterase family protein [Proteobacteria bacterium]|nr:metallophosphoesterase family protein [Pseudomonadota bacterium]
MSAPESHPPAPDTLAADGHDLGSLALPVLLFGGTYGNVQATQAIRDEAHRLRIPPARVLCTGDVCAYFAEPEACVQLIRDWGIAVVMGNCEESLGFGMDDCGCGFAEGTACDLLSQAWYAFSAEALSDPSKAWMRTLPRRIRFSANGRTFTALHGAPDAINRFVFASDNALAGFMAEAGTDDVIGGHAGLQFTRRIGNRLWHNPGAIGMPANDGTTDVWYSLLADDGAGGVRPLHRRLAYDHATAARRMREAGLSIECAGALESGLWPSLDVLPPLESARTGQPLAEDALVP